MPEIFKLKDELPAIIEKVLSSFGKEDIANHIGAHPLPSKTQVAEILDDFFAILFPGYYGRQDLTWENMKFHIGLKIDELFAKLVREFWKAIRHECKRLGSACAHCDETSEREALALLEKIPALRTLLAEDVQAAFDGDPAAKSYDEVIISYPAIVAIATHRIAHEIHLRKIPLIPRIMSELAHGRTGIDIHPGAQIGRRFFIDHGTGVVVGETTQIGDDVKIYQGVTLGALSFPKDACGKLMRGVKRHPTIQDKVTIYSGATILGGDTVIGKGAVIGGNVWLTHSVDAGTRVIFSDPQLKFHNAEHG